MNLAGPSKTEEGTYRRGEEIVRSESASKGFSGEVLCHDISEIIRSLSLAKLDIALIIKNDRKDGKVIFKGGQIMASICGDLKGQEALSEIMSWKQGRFTLYRIFDGTVCRK
jgi:hypothetical protein